MDNSDANKGNLTSSTTGNFYFAYGSNLSPTQMRYRCHHDPTSSQPCALARLDNHKWLICQRGYANVVRLPSDATSAHSVNTTDPEPDPETIVYGLLYNLSPADEARLDRYEGHNSSRNPNPTPNPDPDPEKRRERPFLQGEWDYNKQYLPVTITRWLRDPKEYGVDSATAKQVRVLVYVDEFRTERGKINEEYIGRMNRGIREAVALGFPEEWVEQVMRRDIPREGEAEEGYVGTADGYVEGN